MTTVRAEAPATSDPVRLPAATELAPAASVRFTEATDPALWNRLALDLPGGTAFHEWSFLDLQERIFGFSIERWMVEIDARPVGILPLARRSRRSPRSPYLEFPFLGPAVPAEHVEAVLRAARRHQQLRRMVLVHFDVAPSLAAAVADAAARIPQHVRLDGTVQIDLSHGSEEQLDARMSKSRRRLIRRTADEGVEARIAQPGEITAQLGPALDAAYTRRGAQNPYPLDIGGQIEDWAADRPDVLLSVATVDGTVVSSDVMLGSHPIAIAWVGARTPDAVQGHADAVLTRFALLRAMQAGHTAVDLAGRVDDDVERYKLSFGGTAVPYLTVEGSLLPTKAVTAVRRVIARR